MKNNRAIGYIVKALSNEITRFVENISAKKYNMTSMQHAIIIFIGIIRKNEAIFQKDVEKEFNIRRSTSSKILQLMEKNGLIKREFVDYDARLKKLVLTDKSRDILKYAADEMKELESIMTKDIDKKDIDIFIKVAQQITSNISKELP